MSRPPLVDRAVVLPEFADVSTAETPVGALLGRRRWNQVGEVGFDVGFDGGAGSLEVAQSVHFVGDELIIGRALQGQEALEEINNFGRPILTPITSASLGLIAGLVFEVVRSKLIEPCTTHSQASGSTGSIQGGGVEILEYTADEVGRQAMNELFLCTWGSIGRFANLLQPPNMGALPPNPRSLTHWANGHVVVRGAAARRNPCRDTEAVAPLATPAAPGALRQSRILRAMLDSLFEPAQYQSLPAKPSEIQFCSVSAV